MAGVPGAGTPSASVDPYGWVRPRSLRPVKRRDGALARRASGAGVIEPAPEGRPSHGTDRRGADHSPSTGRNEASGWTDVRLVRECVRGHEEAWQALLQKYKNLIFSIPIRRGMPRDDAADVFQRVCLLLLAELPQLREARALPMWLIRVTSHECERWRRQEHPYAARETPSREAAEMPDSRPLPEATLARLGEEQALRDAVAVLPPRCQKLVEMLFFETPARPYQQIADELGLAVGSIGFIRGRCLTRLRRELEKRGLR
jgi:RNA polymerase sigma factor (sigma-70 family)